MTRSILFLIAAVAAPACRNAGAAKGEPALQRELRHDLAVLAHDSLRGRGTPSSELESAARYVAARFAELGLEPFGGTDFIHRYAIATSQVFAESVSIAFPGAAPIRAGRELVLVADHGAPRVASGELVVLSGSITDSSTAHLNFDGTTLVVPRPGRGLNAGELARLSNLLMWTNPHALVFVADLPHSALRAVAHRGGATRRLEWDPLDLRGATRTSHGIFLVRAGAVRRALAAEGLDLAQLAADTAGPLRMRRFPGRRVRAISPRRVLERQSAPNIIAVLEGGDPDLRNQIVVVSAHLDHLGVGAPTADGDSVYNGADDNASGVAALLAVAGRLRAGPRPHRSLLFLVTSGEETGFWGSDAFAGDPATPLARLVANINLDGIGRPAWHDSIAVLGGAWSTLGESALEASKGARSAIAPTFAPVTGYSRSDHYSFARRGIPAVHLFSGKLFPYYHTPADQVDVVDFDWLARVAQYAHGLVGTVANQRKRPAWTDPHHPRGEVPW